MNTTNEQKANMEEAYQTTKLNKSIECTDSNNGRYIYSVFHTMMTLVAIYLSFRCNKGFEIGPFLVAILCPYLYIIYILATKGTCGILESENKK